LILLKAILWRRFWLAALLVMTAMAAVRGPLLSLLISALGRDYPLTP
jgi:hypothetical protein